MADDGALERLLQEQYGDPRSTYRNPLMALAKEQFERDQFALPPPAPRYSGEIRNLAPRPSDALAPVSEALAPFPAAYGLGEAAAGTWLNAREGNYRDAAREALPLGLAALPIPGARVPPMRLYHGTRADFKKFDPSYFQDFGLHLGTERQARFRAENWMNGNGERAATGAPRVMEVEIAPRQILDVTRDLDWGHPPDLFKLLSPRVSFTDSERQALLKWDREPPPAVASKMRDADWSDHWDARRREAFGVAANALTRNGYDAIRYPNMYEGAGSSYAVWKPGSVRSLGGKTLFGAAPIAGMSLADFLSHPSPTEQ